MQILIYTNENMKKILLLFWVILVPLLGKAQLKNNTQEQIPIVGWYGIPQHGSVRDYIIQREAGITYNLVDFYANLEQITRALDAANKAGSKVIVGSKLFATEPEELVRQIKDHPALAGYALKDEPAINELDSLSRLVKRIQKIDPVHFCYINLLPNYAKPESFGGSYEYYVKSFLEKIPVSFLSFDHYPIYKDGKSDNLQLRKDWYQNLEIISTQSRRSNNPFWAFALTTSHVNSPAIYPIPTISQIRLQVYSNLAYGAQGIQYFTYWTPPAANPNKFNNGPIFNGKITDVYNMIKEVNKEISNLSEVFLNAEVVSVYHTGKTIPLGTTKLTKLPKDLKTLKINGDGAVVSLLTKGDYFFLVVINRDLHNKLQLQIQGKKSFTRILKNGGAVPVGLKKDSQELESGDIEIYRWNK